MSPKQKKMLTRIIISFVFLVIAFCLERFLSLNKLFSLSMFLVPYLIIGWDILLKSGRNILRGKVFDENFLMSIATIGAFCIGQFEEAVVVMLFYQVGELFQSYAVSRSRKSISDLMDIKSDYANKELDGKTSKVDPEDLNVGDIIIVKPGEKIPVDGVVLDGSSNLNTSALTGEPLPRKVFEGNEVLSGCINMDGLLRVKVTKEFYDSTVAKILDLVENAVSKKAKAENFITKFARYYTPFVVIFAVCLAIFPPLLLSLDFGEWVSRALVFLVVSCPCALVISVPLSFFGGIGGASKEGILIKGGSYIEVLSKVRTIVFDKTGTLTHGTFKVVEIHPEGVSKDELLKYAATVESFSNHPIAVSIKNEYKKDIDSNLVKDFKEVAGYGLKATVDGKKVSVGNSKMMEEENAKSVNCETFGTIVHVAVEGKYIGHIIIADEIKSDSKQAIEDLKSQGVSNTVMLTGDRKEVADKVANELGVNKVFSQLLPGDKVEKVEEILDQTQKSNIKNNKLAFVGDGINDAPVLMRADVGIAMGAMGSDVAIEAADIVLMDDKPSKIAQAIKISKKTMRIVKQNIWFALMVKALVLLLGALGLANMWEAVFADVGVSIIAIINASRVLKTSK